MSLDLIFLLKEAKDQQTLNKDNVVETLWTSESMDKLDLKKFG